MSTMSLQVLALNASGADSSTATKRSQSLKLGRRRHIFMPSASSSSLHQAAPSHTVHLGMTEVSRMEELKEGVKKTLRHREPDLALVDTIQHLGISHHFEEEIDAILRQSCRMKHEDEEDLFVAPLRFRLLRQGGYDVSQDAFHKFVDKEGKFKKDLRKDLLGLLSLHEASFWGSSDEEVLSNATAFSKQHIRKAMQTMDVSMARGFGQALASPMQRRMKRLEARSYIEKQIEYGRRSSLLELATLDFNRVQRLYQTDIAKLTSWWNELGLAKKLSFARDRPFESFFWAVGMHPEPCFSFCRIEVAKAVTILHVIDDIYDTYGSLEELDLFTDAIRRWEVDATKDLPDYMKIGYMAIYSTTNEIGAKILAKHGFNAVPHLRKTWVDLCEAYLLEARCFRAGVVPTLEDYLSNAVTTSGTYLALAHAFFLVGRQVTKENVDLVNSNPSLFTNSGRILRLWDDLGTTTVEQLKGDDASSLNCYMKHNANASESDARDHVKLLIDNSWQELIKDSVTTAPYLPRSMINASVNLARTVQAVYQHGDDDGAPSVDDNIQILFTKPIQNEYSLKPGVGSFSCS